MTAPRRFLVPEVIQTSLMDCGPAALKAVLEGFGIDVGYEALRERCQTSIDGTSIDALAALGAELGLASHEMVVPHDHFLLDEAGCLPAIVVTRAGGGLLHFLVVWRTLGPYVQIMDPSGGRAWVRRSALLERMPEVEIPISNARWRTWAGSEDALAPLRARMRAAGIGPAAAGALIERAQRDETWLGFGALDAGVRMIAALLAAGATPRGAPAERLLESLVDRTLAPGADRSDGIPKRFWWASPALAPGKLTLRGPVIVHFSGRNDRVAGSAGHGASSSTGPAAPPSVLGDGTAARTDPLRLIVEMIRLDCPRAIGLLALALAASAVVTGIDTFLLLGVLGMGRFLALDYQRGVGVISFAAFAAAALGLELFVSSVVHRVGRGLETRLRVGLLRKVPRLEDAYLRSRPTSDMASRGHQMQLLREVPALATRILRAGFGLVVTTAAIVWLYPQGLGWALAAAAASVVLPWLGRRPLGEISLRFRTHATALDRFYLDALLGVTPIRVHGAERAVSREHEALLVDWARTGRSMHARNSAVQAAQALTSTAIGIVLVAGYLAARRPLPALLLLAVWAFRVAAAGQDLAISLAVWRDVRSVAMRLFAPLAAAEVARGADRPAIAPKTSGVRIELRDVTVRSAGITILRGVCSTIPAGSHVAIVGASGAGKSSLVGLLLGWLSPTEGALLVDGAELDQGGIARLRGEVAWVDPAVLLWNRSLVDNVTFGDGDGAFERLPEAMRVADLGDVLASLPEGMKAPLGEGGARLSGGQGQRVRLARALVRKQPRLVILDEPFRGLERERRRDLKERARARWKDATLLFVSHDVSDTTDLDRVLVIEGGALVEDGRPEALLADPKSRYSALVSADAALRAETWSAARWRRRTVEHGRVVETREAAQAVQP